MLCRNWTLWSQTMSPQASSPRDLSSPDGKEGCPRILRTVCIWQPRASLELAAHCQQLEVSRHSHLKAIAGQGQAQERRCSATRAHRLHLHCVLVACDSPAPAPVCMQWGFNGSPYTAPGHPGVPVRELWEPSGAWNVQKSNKAW